MSNSTGQGTQGALTARSRGHMTPCLTLACLSGRTPDHVSLACGLAELSVGWRRTCMTRCAWLPRCTGKCGPSRRASSSPASSSSTCVRCSRTRTGSLCRCVNRPLHATCACHIGTSPCMPTWHDESGRTCMTYTLLGETVASDKHGKLDITTTGNTFQAMRSFVYHPVLLGCTGGRPVAWDRLPHGLLAEPRGGPLHAQRRGRHRAVLR